LIWNSEHAHPATQDAEGIDGVKGLRTPGNLCDGECTALSGPNTAGGERNPVDLVLEYPSLLCVANVNAYSPTRHRP
jgi:hypothetical protein